jgi:hypothetical protein
VQRQTPAALNTRAKTGGSGFEQQSSKGIIFRKYFHIPYPRPQAYTVPSLKIEVFTGKQEDERINAHNQQYYSKTYTTLNT